MRLWSIHPKYLDRIGLIALWREALLAQKVLSGKTKGYKHHPQLLRFKSRACALSAIAFYLHYVYKEGKARGYRFDKRKIARPLSPLRKIKVTRGQAVFEARHLLRKLKKRDARKFMKLMQTKKVRMHPLFVKVKGAIESWEKV